MNSVPCRWKSQIGQTEDWTQSLEKSKRQRGNWQRGILPRISGWPERGWGNKNGWKRVGLTTGQGQRLARALRLKALFQKIFKSEKESETKRVMASPDKKAQFNLESPDRTRPAWSERIQMNGSPERARLAWSSSSKSQTSNGGSPETTQSSWSKAAQSKIENPEKTRSNWSRAIQSPDADIEQDHAVRTHHHSQSRDCQTHQYYIDTTIIICSNPNVIIFLHIFLK